MQTMKAIVISTPGGPEVLKVTEVPRAVAGPGQVLIRVRAFGLNHAEAYFRAGVWRDATAITGIECAGEVADSGASGLRAGQRVFALLGGMGRTINGSYAEYVSVPASNAVPIESAKGWAELASLPESYATAWVLLHDNLALAEGRSLLVRGGTSALGQAAIVLARQLGARVFATTRHAQRRALIERLGATPLLDDGDLRPLRGELDAVLDLVGVSTVLRSCGLVRYGGRVALAGFLGGVGAVSIDPLEHLPSGVQLSFFASAFALGTSVSLDRVPFQRWAEDLTLPPPAHVFDFGEIVAAHQLMESGRAEGKIVVVVDSDSSKARRTA